MNYETKTTVITKVKHELHVNFDDVASTFGGTIDPDDLKVSDQKLRIKLEIMKEARIAEDSVGEEA